MIGGHVAERLAWSAGWMAQSDSPEELERRYISAAAELLPGRSFGFYLLEPDTHVGAMGVGEYFLARYEPAGRAVDPLLQYTLAHGSAVTIEQLMSEAEWLAHPMYTEACYLHAMTRLIEAPVLACGRVAGTLCVAGRDSSPALSMLELAIVGSLDTWWGWGSWRCPSGLCWEGSARRCRRRLSFVIRRSS